MNGLEYLRIIGLCAQAMELDCDKISCMGYFGYFFERSSENGHEPDPDKRQYDPLNNDEQAMALAKRFGLLLDPQQDGQDFAIDPGWEVSHVSLPDSLFIYSDLNRAICECVAHMQAEKNKNRLQPGTS